MLDLHLDIYTIMIMVSATSFLCAGIMTLISFHSENVKGASQWALGLFCTGTGLAISVAALSGWPSPLNVFGPVGVGFGLGFIYCGIEAFKGQRCNYWLPFALGVQMVIQNYLFYRFQVSIRTSLIANSTLFSVVFAMCAWAAMVKAPQPLRTAYVFATSSFAFVAVVGLFRIYYLYQTPAESMTFLSQGKINPVFVMLAGVGYMSIALSLVLMAVFKLATDLREQASLDSLTGLLNRRSFEQESARLMARAIRTGEPVAAIMIDVDFFKRINDLYGHQAGDEVLRRMAVLLRSVISKGNCLARYGGEEFCIMLSDTDEAGAVLLAERIRLSYLALRIQWNDEVLNGTLSAGVADSRALGADLSAMVGAADMALYRAKNEGRNRIAAYSDGIAEAGCQHANFTGT